MSHTARMPRVQNELLECSGKFLQDNNLHDIRRRGIFFTLCGWGSLKPGADGSGDTVCRPQYTRCTWRVHGFFSFASQAPLEDMWSAGLRTSNFTHHNPACWAATDGLKNLYKMIKVNGVFLVSCLKKNSGARPRTPSPISPPWTPLGVRACGCRLVVSRVASAWLSRRFSLMTEDFTMHCKSLAFRASLPCLTMLFTNGADIVLDALNCFTGGVIRSIRPSPPCLAGKANSRRVVSLGGGWPVNEGIRRWRIANSRGCSTSQCCDARNPCDEYPSTDQAVSKRCEAGLCVAAALRTRPVFPLHWPMKRPSTWRRRQGSRR